MCAFRKNVGFALCYNSSYQKNGRFFLEDFYVKPAYRSHGVGQLIFDAVKEYAKRGGNVLLDFHVLGWNPARSFYKRNNAVDMTETKEWHFFRMDRKAMETLLANSK